MNIRCYSKKSYYVRKTTKASSKHLIWWLTLALNLWKCIKLFTDAQGLYNSIHQ